MPADLHAKMPRHKNAYAASPSAATVPTRTSLAADAELLFRFVHDRDDAAFYELVKTHLSLVIGVCRQVLQNESDADDACQATFIILAKQGHKVRDPNSLASWLYRVAYRVSCSVRKERRDGPVADGNEERLTDDDVLSKICHRETLLILHEELSRNSRR
jgi:DNA-directed RNA polymerase specialized sigma24 family protein